MPGATSMSAYESVADLTARLRVVVNGYHRKATEAVLTQLVAAQTAAAKEREQLRRRVEHLGRELAQQRSEDVLTTTLLSAAGAARGLREDTSREVERKLNDARTDAQKTLDELAQERADAERQLLHVREIGERARAELRAIAEDLQLADPASTGPSTAGPTG
jgi:chromosome segregation ATPase